MIRVLAALVLALLTAGLLAIGIGGIVDAATAGGSVGGGAAIACILLALFCVSVAGAVARGRARAAAAPRPAPVTDIVAGLPGADGLAGLPSACPGVRYRERCSQFPVTGAVAAVVLAASGIIGLVRAGGPNGPGAGAGGVLTLAGALVGTVYILLVLLDLPNGIRIDDGWFAVGVSGVRPAGRLWRRVAGPLDAIIAWEVLSAAQAHDLGAARRAAAPRGRPRKYLGDLRMFGRRRVLMLRVDPAAVQVSFPARILVGYVLVPTAVTGAVWDGVVLIGTRRPARLAGALAQALPGRCLTGDAT